VAERRPFLLRIDPGVLESLQRWANDDLRSLNAQIEFVPAAASSREALSVPGSFSRLRVFL
jgi:hypothetical protein